MREQVMISAISRPISRSNLTASNFFENIRRAHIQVMSQTHDFSIQPIGRFVGASQPVKRPKEFTCFSYDDNREFHHGDSSLKYYYTPELGADLYRGFESFQKHDDSNDEHLDGLLSSIMEHEQREGKKIDVNIVTWRGMMTKIMATPFDQMDGFSMNATKFDDCIFIEDNHAAKMESRQSQEMNKTHRSGPPLEQIQFSGYKFETLSTLPQTWSECSRELIENRENEVVNNKEQYCSVVRTGIGSTTLCLGGEVDAVWDSKPQTQGASVNWVELKTSTEIRHPGQMETFNKKLMKYWIQSFLIGVPKIIVGFRSRDGILVNVEEIQTHTIPGRVSSGPNPAWNGDMCVNFASEFLEWLRKTIVGDGVWTITRDKNSPIINVQNTMDTGHGRVLTKEFVEWRNSLANKAEEAP